MRRFDTAPQLACHVGKLPLPKAVASRNDEVCALTGVDVPAGTAGLVPWRPTESFRDQYSIVDRSSGYVAAETAAILAKPYMQKYSKSVISPDGWFKFASTNDVAWFLRNPPTPPFVMVYGLARMEHMLWRTPLSFSRELFFVRLGHRVLRILHSRLLAADEKQDACLAAVNQRSENHGTAAISAPFLLIARQMNGATSGQLHPAVLDAAEAGIDEAAQFVAAFTQLSSGELWALGRLNAGRRLPELTQPQPLNIHNQESSP